MSTEFRRSTSVTILTCSTCSLEVLLKTSMSSMQTRTKPEVAANVYISQELGMLKHAVHDSWECGWFIGVAKRQYPELVVAR